MILSKTVKLHWVGNIKSIYEEKGYKYTGNKTEFEVKIEDLLLTSRALVKCTCDNLECNEIFERPYLKVSDKDKHYCKKCSHKYGKRKEQKYYDLDKMKNDLLNLINNKYNGRLPKRTDELFGTKYKTASWDIYKDRFKINSVEQLLNLFDYCIHPDDLLRLRKNNIYYILSKDEVINRILFMQSKLNRPLMYDDFRNPKEYEVGITTIRKHFGTMNQMKEELGLEINQEDMISKHIDDFNTLVKELQFVCDIVEKDDRNIITSKDITSINRLNLNYQSFQKRSLENNTSVRSIIESYGFELQKEGNGLVYFFDDGEKTVSQYELNFSNKLREYGYIFNKDYKRDVRYKTFISNYNELMNCDYVININGENVYIELAGMLKDKNEIRYRQNIEIRSKSKQLYADKLRQKENMFISQNLNYFILFPSDLKEDSLDFLFENKLNIQRKDAI